MLLESRLDRSALRLDRNDVKGVEEKLLAAPCTRLAVRSKSISLESPVGSPGLGDI